MYPTLIALAVIVAAWLAWPRAKCDTRHPWREQPRSSRDFTMPQALALVVFTLIVTGLLLYWGIKP